MSNMRLAKSVLEKLYAEGVREFILCAGARNAPFVTLLSEVSEVKVYNFFEERSAAFFAIGRILSTQKPVAVITTSGTAAAELLPATIEADYQGLPLVLVTADRPSSFRGTGAPQAIEQVGILSRYVSECWDLEIVFPDRLSICRERPTHLNVCFREPLLDEKLALNFVEVNSLEAVLLKNEEPVHIDVERPLIILGAIPVESRSAILNWVCRAGRPVYAEAQSGLRGRRDLASLEIRGGTPILADGYDSVIRIGSVPTLRLWRDLETSALPVYHFSNLPSSGMARERRVNSFAQLLATTPQFKPNASAAIGQALVDQLESALALNPLSEPSWFRWLSHQMPREARVFLGNSLPIREWDLAAHFDSSFVVFANRGVNGIDGLVSTFLGICENEQANWCILGDLSAMYDLVGLWAQRERPVENVNIVVVNNGGGKIFSRIFNNRKFENSHSIQFKGWAEMWGWDYEVLSEPRQLGTVVRPRIIEIQPSVEQTANFWNLLEESK